MFRIIITGRTPDELYKNLLDMAASTSFDKDVTAKKVDGAIAKAIDRAVGPDETVATFFKDNKIVDQRVIETPSIPKYVPEGFGTPAATTTVAPKKTKAAATPNFDAKGIPWDERIHSANKTVDNKGQWRMRRNLPDGEYDRVMAEISQGATPTVRDRVVEAAPTFVPPAPEPLSQPQAAPVFSAPAFVPQQQPVQAVVHAPPVQAPAVAQLTPPPWIRPSHDLGSFRSNFMQFVTMALASQIFTRDYIAQLNSYFKIQDIWNLLDKGNEAKLTEMFETLAQQGVLLKVGA